MADSYKIALTLPSYAADPRAFPREPCAVAPMATSTAPRSHKPVRIRRSSPSKPRTDDLTGAPDELRQAALRAWDRPWMTAFASLEDERPLSDSHASPLIAPSGNSPPKVEELIARMRAQRLAAGSPALGGGGTLAPPLDLTPRVPPPSTPTPAPKRKSLTLRSPTFPISLDKPLPYVPFPASNYHDDDRALLLSPSGRAKTIEEIITEYAPSALSPRLRGEDPMLRERRRYESEASQTSSEALRLEIDRVDRARTSAFGLVPGLRATSTGRDDDATPRPPAAGFVDEPTAEYAAPVAFPILSDPATAGLDRLLRSPRLTQIATLRQPGSHAGVRVSYADVGDPSGHPVIVFLGLASIRYLVALFDELAASLGLRVLCFDRWALGKTTAVPDSQRGFSPWADIVAELVSPSQLNLSRFSILAHSAGAPYAIAAALHPTLASQISGSLHLLAPWVVNPLAAHDSLAGVYKLLKYVPSGVIKSAQQAERKVQSWKLGKMPTSPAAAPVGYTKPAKGEDEAEEERTASPLRGTPTRHRKRNSLVGGLGGLFGPASAKPESATTTTPSPTRSKRFSFMSAASSGRDRPASVRTSSTRSGTDTVSGSPVRATALPNGFAVPADEKGNLPSPTRFSGLLSPGSPSPPAYRRGSSASTVGSSLSRTTSPGQALSPVSSATTADSRDAGDPSKATIPPAFLIEGLMRASHAESLSGSTSDLLVLLDRVPGSTKRDPLDYQQVRHPVKVWYGTRDERISYASIEWLERELRAGAIARGAATTERECERACTVKLVERAGHSLMAGESVSERAER